jgi:hypothetical protein
MSTVTSQNLLSFSLQMLMMVKREPPPETVSEIAKWMLGELQRLRVLDQNVAAYGILQRFGQKFTYTNANGNLAIDRRVLAQFRDLTGDAVVWERGTRCWRSREHYDERGRQQG